MRLIVPLLILFGIFGKALGEVSEDQDAGIKEFYSSEIKKATTLYIQQALDPEKNFVIFDEKTGETLKLKFLKFMIL